VSEAYNPLITVHIATYNYPEVLACAIQSVLQQTYANFELLITGDGCDDSTAACIAQFSDPRISYKNLPENHGAQSQAQNDGLARAKGEWIALLGHDDIWHPTHLETLVNAARRDPACEFFFTFTHAILDPDTNDGRTRALYGFAPDGLFEPSVVAPPVSWMHRPHVVQQISGWRPWQQLYGATDYDVILRVWASGVRIQNVPALTAYKVTASVRKEVYKLRPNNEQKLLLQRMADEPDFLYRESMLMFESLTQPSFARIARDLPSSFRRPGDIMRRYLKRRGLPDDHPVTMSPHEPLAKQPALLAYFNYADDITPLESRRSLHESRQTARNGAYLGYGWRERERDRWGRPFRWAQNGAELLLTGWQGKHASLEFTASIEGRLPRNAKLTVQDASGRGLHTHGIFHDTLVRVPLDLPPAELHTLRITTTEQAEKSKVGDGLVVLIRDIRLVMG
jgi:glycosyltransferase involved in cell wall biosynthesis